MNIETLYLNYLVTKQSAKLNYWTKFTQKLWGQKHKLELESELKYAEADHDSRGGYRGRVQGVHTPPRPPREMKLSSSYIGIRF